MALSQGDSEFVWELHIPIRTGDPTGSPMTYRHSGKPYIVFAAGGALDDAEVIALSLQ